MGNVKYYELVFNEIQYFAEDRMLATEDYRFNLKVYPNELSWTTPPLNGKYGELWMLIRLDKLYQIYNIETREIIKVEGRKMLKDYFNIDVPDHNGEKKEIDFSLY